jgi:hypothetical protein
MQLAGAGVAGALGATGGAMGNREGGTAELGASMGVYSYDRPAQPDFDGLITGFDALGIWGPGIGPVTHSSIYFGAGVDDTSARAIDGSISFEGGLAYRGARERAPWLFAVMGGIATDSIADTALDVPVSVLTAVRLGPVRASLKLSTAWRYFRDADDEHIPDDTSGPDRMRFSAQLDWGMSGRRPFVMISGTEVDELTVTTVLIGARIDFEDL